MERYRCRSYQDIREISRRKHVLAKTYHVMANLLALKQKIVVLFYCFHISESRSSEWSFVMYSLSNKRACGARGGNKSFEKDFQANRVVDKRYNTLKDEDICVYEVLPRTSCVPMYVSE